MSKKRNNATLQLALSLLESGGLLSGVLDEAATLLAEIIRKSKFSREQLCDKLKALLGRPIAPTTFYAWTTSTNRNRLPADVLVALCFILNDFRPIAALLAPLGFALADKHEQALAEIGRVQLDREHLAARESAARRQLEGGN